MSSAAEPQPVSDEHASLLATKQSILASIASREKQLAPSADFLRVTDMERGRVREIAARIEQLVAAAKSSQPAKS